MSWVDPAIVVLLALAALHGWRRGAATQLLAIGGFCAGLLVGVLIAPPLARPLPSRAQAVVAILVVLGSAVLLGIAGELLGMRIAGLARRLRLVGLDEALGVAVSVIGTLMVVWLVGNVLAAGRALGLDRALQRSAILSALNRSLPDVPSIFAQIESFLSVRGFPVVFVNVPPELLPPPRAPADAAVRAAMAVAGPSTVKVAGPACASLVEGSGFVAAPQLVVTNAHVIAGDRRPRVIDEAGSHQATPVVFDPGMDVAVLRVPGLDDRPLPLYEGTVPRATTAAALGYPGDGGLLATPAAVNGLFSATGLDIYGERIVTRRVYAVNAYIRSGSSGGPLVSTGAAAIAGGTVIAAGTVIGVVFARSTTDAGIGYALTAAEVEPALRRARAVTGPVGTGACLG